MAGKGGMYCFVDELGPARTALLADRARYDVLLEEEEAREDQDRPEPEGGYIILDVTPIEAYGTWWFHEEGCEGNLFCECGPVTLLDVLRACDEEMHQRILVVHVAGTSEVYGHFWAAHGALGNSQHELRNVCVGCFTAGAEHALELLGSAQQLGTELGEALAAYESTIALGAFRYQRETV